MMIRCSGCGGSNSPGALLCEWCRRPLVPSRQRGLSARWWGVFSGAIVLVLLVMIGILLFLNANRTLGRSTASAPTPAPPLPPFTLPAAGSPTPLVVAAGSPTPFSAAPLAASGVSTPNQAATVKLARVTNTGGQGLNLRREPATSALAVATVGESTTLRLVGPEQRSPDGRVWKQVEDSRGNQGWVPAEYLVEVHDGG
jgi:hypothetical protein